MNQKKSRIFNIENQHCTDFVCQFDDKEEFIAAFRYNYEFVIAYHATNINKSEQEDILTKGITVSNDEFIRQKAISRFIRPDDSAELQQRIMDEIDGNFDEEVFVQKRIFLSHLKHELMTVSRQYLLYGTESLLFLADKLRDLLKIDFRQRMIDYGEHCIISVSVPESFISNSDVGAIYEHLVNNDVECCIECIVSLPQNTIVGIEICVRPENF